MSSLAALLKASEVNAHAVLAAADAALTASRSDSFAQTAKAVALLKLDRFEDALEVFRSAGTALQRAAPLEYAYALYTTGHLEDARKVAEGIDDHGGRHLEAQLSYRAEDFPHASEIYKALWESCDEAEENDLRINISATDAQLQWSGHGELVAEKKPRREDLESFMTAYNAACGCLARGELGQAEVLLKRASDLCLADESMAEGDKKIELLSIKVQRLYALGVQSKTQEAESLAKEIEVEEIQDLGIRQIGQINKLALQGQPPNPYLAQRIFQSTPRVQRRADMLFTMQNSLIQQNSTALDMLMSKFKGVAKSTARKLEKYPVPTTNRAANAMSAINAAATAQGQLGKMGLKSILPLLERRPLDAGLVLTIVQLYMLTKNHGAAITVMESFFKRLEEAKSDSAQVRFAPGLVAVLVSLYSIEGRKSHIRRELARAATFWRHRSRTYPSFFQASGLSLLQSDQEEDIKQAQEIFTFLQSNNPDDITANAGFVAAFAITDPAKVAGPASKLTPIEKLTASINVAALDASGIPIPRSAVAAQAAKRKRAAESAAKPAKKRMRKSRLPKDHDPSKKPDPERWLPLRDRSTYKPKGKKGKQKQAALTQGGISKDTDSGAEAAKPEAAKGGGGGGGGGGKKKKGKRK